MLKAFRLSELLQPLDARLLGADADFAAVSIDSRSVTAGQLFVALSGPNFDGHNYLAEVATKGAVAALVEREVAGVNLPQLLVADARVALGQLAGLNRQAYQGPLAAVTGSSGKTTVKELLASILRVRGPVLATRGNLNNDLGAPLTLLELAPQHCAAVIELGASRIGEIAYTVGLTQPQVAIITNAGTAHVGEFGGPENIVLAKGEILEGLTASGTAILNLDDAAFATWQTRAQGRQVVSFALSNSTADFYASELTVDGRGCPMFTLHCPAGSAQVQLNLLGQHNVSNALAAAAAAYSMGVPLAEIVQGLQALQPVKGRTVAQLLGNGVRLIDDSYNANPAAINAATDLLSSFAGRRILVLGDMGELGAWAESAHAQVGAYAVGKVDALYAVGTQMAHAVVAFGGGAQHFADQTSLIAALASEQGSNTSILIKGSRSAAMEHVVAALAAISGESH
jgi:UDP-N-acetylmuramoyl-tripeptide--D-alanyl-D-alanine ligase